MAYKYPQYYGKYRWMVSVTQCPNHPSYGKYGAQGIQCYWQPYQYKEFEHWLLSTLGHQPTPKHQLCRIDKSGDWVPGNIRWMLPKQRSRTMTKQNVYATYKRKKQVISDWADELGIPFYTLRRRVARGIPIKDIIKEFKHGKT